MTTQGYEAVFMKEDIKKELKILSVTEGKTFTEMVEKLINFYQANK